MSDLNRLVEDEIEALADRSDATAPQVAERLVTPAIDTYPTELDPAETRFIERAANWLSTRPAPERLLSLLSERVLGSAKTEQEGELDQADDMEVAEVASDEGSVAVDDAEPPDELPVEDSPPQPET